MRSKKAILNIVSSLMLQVVTLICGFIVPKLIIEHFGSNVNGLVSSITQFLAYITLLEAGIGPVVKSALYAPIAKKDKKQIENILKAAEKFFRVIAIIFVVYLIVLSVVYPMLVKSEFAFVYTMSLVIIISVSTLSEYYFGMVYKLYLQAEQKTYITSIIQMIAYILNTIVIVCLVKANANIQIIKLASGIIFVLRPIVQNIYVKKKYNINLKEADKEYKLKQKWDGLAQHIASVIHNNTDITILTILAPISEVSVYSIYMLIIRGIKSIIQAFSGGIDASFGDMIAKGENEQLNKSFKTYELFYYTIATIAYACTIVLIVPFVKVYTKNITDANYIRPVFAAIMVIAEFIWAIRMPYSGITLAAGHFKETQKGAWVESLTNIIVSVILVFKFGIIGVAIGTLAAMLIRTVEFMYHTNKYILKRKQVTSIIRAIITIIELVAIVIVSRLIPKLEFTSYIEWIKYAIMILITSMAIVLPINLISYKADTKNLLNMLKRNISKSK